jgi:type I restriction enzyme S subunit
MKRWLIDDAEDHISQLALLETSAKRIPRGAVLAVVRGMILAHTWPIAVTTVDVSINQDMKAMCPDSALRAEYLGYLLRARSRQVLSIVETSAHGTKRLRTENLLRVLVPDAPLAVQDEIVAHLDEVQSNLDEMWRLQNQDSECLDQLEEAILERAFRGEL